MSAIAQCAAFLSPTVLAVLAAWIGEGYDARKPRQRRR